MLRIGITERGDAGVHLDEVLAKADEFDGVILITKNPQLLIDRYEELPLKCIVHCSITGYGGTKLEPGVPAPDQALIAYRELVSEMGPKAVVLRVDPIMPTEKGLAVAKGILEGAKGRVRISFLDNYSHSHNRMVSLYPGLGPVLLDAYHGELHAPLPVRQQMLAELESYIHSEIEVCGEPGLKCTGCVSQEDIDSFRIPAIVTRGGSQRNACACLAPKTEMLAHRGQCKHGCAYCYWK